MFGWYGGWSLCRFPPVFDSELVHQALVELQSCGVLLVSLGWWWQPFGLVVLLGWFVLWSQHFFIRLVGTDVDQ